ncbi:MAG: NAD(P)/FAD-dependent oxidoreductase [Syntrophomonadaceae bacterium]|nr:NAD(P)/FAD-dependent oxidoreductase [Syntrophomonadaceae bacterium]
MSREYDVIIIGAGPAGIFCALELAAHSSLSVLMVEKGREVAKRQCVKEASDACRQCQPCSITSGWGGAGAFSDGKLTLTTEFGGWLEEYVGKERLAELIAYVDAIYVRHGAPDRVFGEDSDYLEGLKRRAAQADLRLIPARIRHMGTENTERVLQGFRAALPARVEVHHNEAVQRILVEDGRAAGVLTEQGQYRAPRVVCAPGRIGAQWFVEEAGRLGLALRSNQVDVGVRVEVPAVVLEEITDHAWEAKIVYYSRHFDDTVRTFCMNPHGEVVMENTEGLVTVNGHSWAGKRSDNTNFALLVSQQFTEPFNQPILYGRSIACLANLLSGGVIVQRYGDLQRGRRSTRERIARGVVSPSLREAVPGDLSLVLPHRYMVDLKETIQALDRLAPGIASDHTLLYGVEVKFYSARPRLSAGLQTEIPGLYAIGDGAGVTRGLVQASVAGVLAARDILAEVG